jgi:hypothetical protein
MMRLGGGVWELGEKRRGALGNMGTCGGGVGTWEHPFDSYDKYMTRCYNTYF